MEISRLAAKDAPTWAWDAANSIVQTRMDSGGLSRSGTTSLTRTVTSTFRSTIPYNMNVWVDDKGGWLWVEYAKNSRVIVRAGFLTEDSDVDRWADFVVDEFSGSKVLWRVWGANDSLVPLVETLDTIPTAIMLRASISSLDTSVGASDAWLRQMGAGELSRFQAAAANERGVVLAASGAWDTVEDAQRAALHEMEDILVDGVASPGHHLYSLYHEGRTVGGVWMEIDGGMAVVHSVVLEAEERGRGHRRAAIDALAATAHSQGARQIEITIVPSDYNFLDALLAVGMDIITVDYIQESARIPMLQRA